MKTSELQGAALDWAVARCEGMEGEFKNYSGAFIESTYNPSTDWAQGGPIIERDKITVEYTGDPDTWCANIRADEEVYGPTPLIAAMRCFVASRLGDEVEIPKDNA